MLTIFLFDREPRFKIGRSEKSWYVGRGVRGGEEEDTGTWQRSVWSGGEVLVTE